MSTQCTHAYTHTHARAHACIHAQVTEAMALLQPIHKESLPLPPPPPRDLAELEELRGETDSAEKTGTPEGSSSPPAPESEADKTVFSEQLIAQAFKEKEMLTGKEILNISPIKQLNLFIIKSLFERWQEEIKKIESPYFDYHAPEVKVMISKFMNVLSQNISVNAENLKPIIVKAVEDLIVLNFDPATYLDNEIKKRPELLFNKKFIPQFAKYLVFHKSLILDFLDVFEANDPKHLKRFAIAFFEKHTLGEHQLVEQLSEILILEKQELFKVSQPIKKNNERN